MFLVCWQLFLLPTVTLGVDCTLELFCRHDKVFPWIRDQRRNQIRQHLQSLRASPTVFIKFCTRTETYKEEKVHIQKLHEIPVPTHPRSMNLKTRIRRYGKNIGRCAFWNSSGQIAALRWNGHNSLVRNQFWANEDSLKRKIHALRNGAMFQYMFCSGNWKKKFVKMR